ncbi:GNAT family N-acetyltransferase [Microlunatus spumicola]|uniref:GNAT family N-acetyltransferase n=1 Tax=Microlunatus spumicola TaxID=81499 RepID=A0ABP6Y9N9_9ACTN
MPDLTLHQVPYDDPAVVALTAQVQAYYREIYGGPDDSPLGDEELVPPAGTFLLARLDGDPAGMGGWRRIGAVDALGGERPAEVRRMYTPPAARHRGVARALLGELERTAAAHGADVMVLSTGGVQADAVAFYRACGYVDIPPFGHWAASPGIVCLGRRLTG